MTSTSMPLWAQVLPVLLAAPSFARPLLPPTTDYFRSFCTRAPDLTAHASSTHSFTWAGDAATQASIPIAGRTRKTVELERGPLPGMPLAPDGLAGVGFSFETTSAGMHIISTLAPTGSAANSGRMQTGDVLRTVNSTDVQGLSAAEVIRLVKGPSGTKVVLGLDVLSSETGDAASQPGQEAAAVSPVRSVTPVHQEPPPMPSPPQQTPLQAPQEALPSPQLPFPDPFQPMQGQPQLVQPQPMHQPPEQPMKPTPQNKDPDPQPRLQQQVCVSGFHSPVFLSSALSVVCGICACSAVARALTRCPAWTRAGHRSSGRRCQRPRQFKIVHRHSRSNPTRRRRNHTRRRRAPTSSLLPTRLPARPQGSRSIRLCPQSQGCLLLRIPL
jgi:hypothetical protein